MDYQTNGQENNTNTTDSAQQTTGAENQNGYNSQQYGQYNPQNYQQNGGQYNQQYQTQNYQQNEGKYNQQYAAQNYQQNAGQYNQQYANQSYQQDSGQYNQQYADQNYQQPGYNYAEQQYGQQYTQPTDENTKPPKKHKKRNFLIILAVLLIGVGIGFLVYRNSDAAILKSAFADLEDKIYDLEAVGAYKKVVENGKMTVTVGTDSEILGGQNLKVETWSNKKQRKSVIKLTSDYAQGSLYASTKGVYAQTDILDDAYGIEFKGMWDRFEQSDLYDYLDADEYEEIISAIENITDDPEGFSDEIKKYIKKYSKELEKEIYKKAERTNQNGILTLTLDNEAVAEIVEDMYKKLKNDKDFQNYLDKKIPLDTISGVPFDKWKEIFDEIEVDQLTSVIEQLDFDVELQITYTSIKHDMKKLEIKFSASGAKVSATLDFSEKDTITAAVKANGTTVAKVKYSESKDGFKLTVNAEGSDQYSITFDKQNGDKYKMKLKTTSYYGEEEIVLEGKYQSNGKHFLFNVDTVTIDDEETVVDITLEMTYKQSMPSFPSNTKDVMSLDEDDIDSIEEQISDWSDEVSDEIRNDYDIYGSYSAVSGTAAITVIMAPTILTAALALIG